jgi:hypothetical protein
MKKWEVVIGETYKLNYPGKEGLICKIVSMDIWGDCDIVFKNGKKDCYHFSCLDKSYTNQRTIKS